MSGWLIKGTDNYIFGPCSEIDLKNFIINNWSLNTLISNDNNNWHPIIKSTFYSSIRETLVIEKLRRTNDHCGKNAHAFYILYNKKNKVTKLGISNNPLRRFKEHTSKTNMSFKSIFVAWLHSESDARKIEKLLIRELHKSGYERTGNEFYSVNPKVVEEYFIWAFEYLLTKQIIK